MVHPERNFCLCGVGAATIPRIGPEEYVELCHRVGLVVRDATPADAVVAVVSKGDPQLLELEGRTGLHFPRDADGRYAGYHPKTSEDAIAHVESLHRAGAQFLCLPVTAFWWLDHYQGLAAWLDAHCRIAVRDPATCVVYDLLRPAGLTAPAELGAGTAQVRSLLDALLPEDALLLVVGKSTDGVSAPGRAVAPLGSSHATGLRRLTAVKADPPTFVMVARDASAPPLEAEFEAFLERRTDPVARREHLCDLLRVRSNLPNRPSVMPPHRDRPSTPARLQGDAAQKLSKRLERIGLPGPDSSGGSVQSISEQ